MTLAIGINVGSAQAGKAGTPFRSTGDSTSHFLFTEVHVDSATQTQVFLLSSDSVKIRTLVDTAISRSDFVILALSGFVERARAKYPDKLIIKLPRLVAGRIYRLRFVADHHEFEEKFLYLE